MIFNVTCTSAGNMLASAGMQKKVFRALLLEVPISGNSYVALRIEDCTNGLTILVIEKKSIAMASLSASLVSGRWLNPFAC